MPQTPGHCAVRLVRPAGIPTRRRLLTTILYFLALLREFRTTLITLAIMLALGAALMMITPHQELAGRRPGLPLALYATWMAMFAQPPFTPDVWYLLLLDALYPVAGVVIIGEGVVRLALLMISRRQGEKEWMRVMASTYTDHVVLCGIGHLGYRVLEQLVAARIPVVVLERDENGKSVPAARTMGIPVLLRDMREDQSLLDAGIERARAIIIATNDDMANLEVALDARRMNPQIRVVMRLFEQQIATKIADALTIDAAFSSSSLAAPLVAALALETKIISTSVIAGTPHVTAELRVGDRSRLVGRRLEWAEQELPLRILARICRDGTVQSPPARDVLLGPGDTLVIHARTDQLAELASHVVGT